MQEAGRKAVQQVTFHGPPGLETGGSDGTRTRDPCELSALTAETAVAPSSRPYLLGAVDIPVLFCHDLGSRCLPSGKARVSTLAVLCPSKQGMTAR